MSKISEYWDKFLAESKQDPDEVGFSGERYFEDRGVTGMTQLALVLSGQKTALFYPYESFIINHEPLPLSDEMYIVEDRNDEPKCIVQLTDVNVIPFVEISWELARRSGEDENLEQWRERQRAFFEEEADICGFDFNDGTRIICEIFSVVYR